VTTMHYMDMERSETRVEAQSGREALLRASLRKPAWHLLFPAELEHAYLADFYQARINHLVFFCFVGIAIYLLYLAVDITLLGDNFQLATQIRLLGGVPFILVMIVMLNRKRVELLTELAVAFGAVFIAMSVLYIQNLTLPEMAPIYNSGTAMVTLYCNVVLQQRFLYAAASSLFILVAALSNRILILGDDPHLPLAIADHIGITGVSLIACYIIDLNSRKNYLQTELLQLETARLQDTKAELEEISLKDPLTGVYNRRYFSIAIDNACKRAERKQRSLALLFLDVDYFKAYNDHYGHQSGDECLVQLTEIIGACLRESDIFARYGGEEFVVLLEDTNAKEAMLTAERVVAAVTAAKIPHALSAVANQVTISVGVAVSKASQESGGEALVHEADVAVYQAKEQGRNRVVLSKC